MPYFHSWKRFMLYFLSRSIDLTLHYIFGVKHSATSLGMTTIMHSTDSLLSMNGKYHRRAMWVVKLYFVEYSLIKTPYLTSEKRILFEKLIVSPLPKHFYLYGAQILTVSKRACHWTLSWATWIWYTLSSNLSMLCDHSGLLPSSFLGINVYTIFISPTDATSSVSDTLFRLFWVSQ
jgi:hypothetical protein